MSGLGEFWVHSEDLGSVKVGGGGDLPQYPFVYLHRGVNNQGFRCPYLEGRTPRSPKIFKG